MDDRRNRGALISLLRRFDSHTSRGKRRRALEYNRVIDRHRRPSAFLPRGLLALGSRQARPGIFFNNIYFLVLTGIIVVVGNHLYNQLRFREFALRFELRPKPDRNSKKRTGNSWNWIEIKSRFFANISHELRTPLTLMLAPLRKPDTRSRHRASIAKSGSC